MNKDYTDSWITGFNEKKLISYHNKFYKNFEKNIKHYQQIEFIRKYLKYDMEWLDAPIGSGRLMDELSCRNMLGFDKSPAFVSYNNSKGRKTIEGDLFNMPFNERFGLITCLHTLFAFDEFRQILKELVSALKKDGILIADIVNRSHIEASNLKCGQYPYKSALTREEIIEFFESLNCKVIEIELHDLYDNRFILHWRNNGNRWIRILKKILYKLLNILYFRLHLKTVFDKFSKNRDKKYYTKYLVAVKKK
ncbi:MAG: methyltransferase domain-containing protein [Phycisphaerae bacterium]|jgi:SAM-dependent methyltransferase